MITTLVQFNLPKTTTVEEARDLFLGTAPKYKEVKGLIRKYYLLSQDGKTAGGVYLWDSRENARNLYTEEWKQFIFEKYGAPPTVTYFECPVIVDNTTGKILSGG
jgi:hypothetical protein